MDNDKRTPLHLAAEWGHRNTAELLLGKGASVAALNKSKETPLQVAARKRHTAIVELLNSNATTAVRGRSSWSARLASLLR